MSYKTRVKFGSVNVPAFSSNVTVSFPDAFQANQTIVVVLTPSWQSSAWSTAVSATGFTGNFGTGPSSDGPLYWAAYMEN
mgnify:CR=1 FL=1